MKVNTAIAALGGVMFIAAGANAAFVGVGWSEVDNTNAGAESIDRTIDVWAEFDHSLDELNAVAGTVLNRLSISVIGGTFYQQAFGTDNAPGSALVAAFPSLAFDTFVTIGALVDDSATTLTPGWPGFGASELGGSQDLNNDGQADGDNMVWSVTPETPQGIAGNSAGNRVVLARLSANAFGPAGVDFEGSFSIQGFADGNLLAEDVAFSTVPAPGALALLGLAGLAGTRRRRA